VGSLDQLCFDRTKLHIKMVSFHGVNHVFALPTFSRNLDSKLNVGALHFPVNCLADIVDQASPLGDENIGPKFRSHHTRKVRNLYGVIEDILTIASSVLESA